MDALADAEPQIVTTDWAKMKYRKQVHLAFQVLDEYSQRHGNLPKPRCQVTAGDVVTGAGLVVV